ncbi:MAG: peptidoglycan recognition protein family protein [Defluviitaleaceae bacterium]|nr:peptidoglycan recognition protein family protein [Defluviitaleaceae bacterium]
MTFNIITPSPKLLFTRNPALRTQTTAIIVHHPAHPHLDRPDTPPATVQDIHRWHLERGWIGIGYNFYVGLDGTIWEGRGLKTQGAHTEGHNATTIGIAFQGNYEDVHTDMPDEQFNAGVYLINFIRRIYGNIPIHAHSDIARTACPGRHFPMIELLNLEFRKKELADMTFRTVQEMPQWAQPGIQQLVDLGVLNGRTLNNLDVDENMMRILLIVRNMFDRAGLLETMAAGSGQT